MRMEDLFVQAGLNYKDMSINEFYDISDKNIKIKSFNHKTNQYEFKKIVSLVRKEDSPIYKLITKNGDVLLKCSGAHRIFDSKKKEYFRVKDIQSGNALSKNNESVSFFVVKTNEIEPIVDMEVEDNENYFSNGILSHNTTSGGSALKYYDSLRIKLTKIGSVDEGTGDDKQKIAVRIKAECVKNKTFPPFKKSEFIFHKQKSNIW